MSITYEWVYEPLDENGDIIDPQYVDTLKQALMMADSDKYDIGLVRFEGSNDALHRRANRLPPPDPAGHDPPWSSGPVDFDLTGMGNVSEPAEQHLLSKAKRATRLRHHRRPRW